MPTGAPPAQPSPRRVLVDCDPATGVRNRDVDDGLALIALLAAPHIEIEGITITFGNVKADVGYGVARDLLDRVGATAPLVKGAGRRQEIGRPNPAVDFLIEAVRQSPGELTLLTLGPLTNVATAMRLDPTFAANLADLVVMGGSVDFKPFAWFGEMNFRWDPVAAAEVVATPVPKSLITMDTCSQAVFRQQQLELLMVRDSDMARYLVAAIDPWLRLNRRFFFRANGFYPWDAVAAAYVIDPGLFGTPAASLGQGNLQVQRTGFRAGRLIHAPAGMTMTLDEPSFMALLMKALLQFC